MNNPRGAPPAAHPSAIKKTNVLVFWFASLIERISPRYENDVRKNR